MYGHVGPGRGDDDVAVNGDVGTFIDRFSGARAPGAVASHHSRTLPSWWPLTMTGSAVWQRPPVTAITPRRRGR